MGGVRRTRGGRAAAMGHGPAGPLLVALSILATAASAEPVRAAYVYDYMGVTHLDSLAGAGFNRVIVRMLGDTLRAPLETWCDRASSLGLDVVADWMVQSNPRLDRSAPTRRYRWGSGTVEADIACPLDSLFWRRALLDRAEEVLDNAPSLTRLAIDLEFPAGTRRHYDAGPCRCGPCLLEYTGLPGGGKWGRHAHRLSGLLPFEESRVTRILTGLLTEFAARHPGVELGVFDLDFDSFVHRALARALVRSGVPTLDYCERSYSVGGSPLAGARARLDALGVARPSLVGGIWLKQFRPEGLASAVRSIRDQADGYFVFTTYSLWREPSELSGPYTLPGQVQDYWRALGEVNQSP